MIPADLEAYRRLLIAYDAMITDGMWSEPAGKDTAAAMGRLVRCEFDEFQVRPLQWELYAKRISH